LGTSLSGPWRLRCRVLGDFAVESLVPSLSGPLGLRCRVLGDFAVGSCWQRLPRTLLRELQRTLLRQFLRTRLRPFPRTLVRQFLRTRLRPFLRTLVRQFPGPDCVSSPGPDCVSSQDPGASVPRTRLRQLLVVVLLPSPRHLRHVVHRGFFPPRGPFRRGGVRRVIPVLVGSADAFGGGEPFEHELDGRRAQRR